MGSSSGGEDYSAPPQRPPPANLIQPEGQSVPYQPNFINFLGDPGQPQTGLTPQMLAQIAGMNGPPPGAPPPGPMGGGMPPAAAAAPAGPDPRQRLAEAFLQQNPTMQRSRREAMEKLAGGPMGGGGRWAEGGGYGGGGLGSSNRGGGGLGMRGGGY